MSLLLKNIFCRWLLLCHLPPGGILACFSFNASNKVNLFPLMASSLPKTYTDLMRMYEKDNYFMKTGGEQDLVKIVS